MQVRVASVSFLQAAGAGYGIGLSDEGNRVEFIGDWRSLAELRPILDAGERVELEREPWQILAVNGELRLPLTREAMAERALFLRATLAGLPSESPDGDV